MIELNLKLRVYGFVSQEIHTTNDTEFKTFYTKKYPIKRM